MIHAVLIIIIAYSCVAASVLIGQSEQAGLFASAIACATYAANVKGGAA